MHFHLQIFQIFFPFSQYIQYIPDPYDPYRLTSQYDSVLAWKGHIIGSHEYIFYFLWYFDHSSRIIRFFKMASIHLFCFYRSLIEITLKRKETLKMLPGSFSFEFFTSDLGFFFTYASVALLLTIWFQSSETTYEITAILRID